MDVLNAVYRPIHKRTGKKFFFPEIREVDGFNNACALVHNDGQRYVVVDPGLWSNSGSGMLGEMIIYGHEVGHHVCGHTIGMFRNQPWPKELEADRFAGAAIRAVHEDIEIADYRDIYEQFTLEAVKNAAWAVYGQFAGGPTHPPADTRVAAVIDGYLNGSSCVEKALLDNPVTGNAGPGAGARSVEPLWDHNGSTMRLAANGAARKFFYENPRSGLGSAGVSRGTLLFTGQKIGNTYSGMAYVFSKCGSRGYAVNGSVSEDQRTVTLYGKAPIVDSSCRMTTNRDDELVFTFVGD